MTTDRRETVTDAEIWDRKAASYDTARRAVWDEPDHTWAAAIEVTLDEMLPGWPDLIHGQILDLGCGIGRLTYPMAERYPDARLVGVDVSAEMLVHAGRDRRQTAAHVLWVQGDGRRLPGDLGPFMGAYSVLMFQHLPQSGVVPYLVAVAGRLVPGAPFTFQWCEGDEHHPLSHGYTEHEMVTWCEGAGLTVEGVRPSSLYPVWRWIDARMPA